MPHTIPFSCRWSDSEVGAAWVRVAGELDFAAAPQLEATLHVAQLNPSKVGRRLMVVRGARQVEELLALTGSAGELETFDLPPATGSATYARDTVWAEA